MKEYYHILRVANGIPTHNLCYTTCMEKLKSRKLWITVLAGALVAFAGQFGVELDPEQIISIGVIAASYIGGQAVVDRGKIVAEVQAGVPKLMAAINEIALQLESSAELHQTDEA